MSANKTKKATGLRLSISAILLVTALAKFYDLAEYNKFRGLLELTDPVITILKMKQTVFIAAVAEIILGAYLIIAKQKIKPLLAIISFVTIIGIYRFIKLIIFAPEPCPCLGSLLKPLHLPKSIEDILPIVILIYIGTASAMALWITKASEPKLS
jgi:ABC-type maltose transport system permease subunit